jgi:hypothetical protein
LSCGESHRGAARTEDLRREELERKRKQQDLQDDIIKTRLQQDKKLQDLLRKKNIQKRLDALKSENLEEKRKRLRAEEDLTRKELTREKEFAEFDREQLLRRLNLIKATNGSREEIATIKQEISGIDGQIKQLTQQTDTIAQLPVPVSVEEHEDEQGCSQMGENLELMQQCNESGQREREYFDGKRERLSKKCPENYTKMDKYKQRCEEETTKEGKCVDFAQDLNDGKMDDCQDPDKRFLRSQYKNIKDYAHCTDQHKILSEIIEKCDGEEKYEDGSAKPEQTQGPTFPVSTGSVNATIAQNPKDEVGAEPDIHAILNAPGPHGGPLGLPGGPPVRPPRGPVRQNYYLSKQLHSYQDRAPIDPKPP